MNEQKRKRWHPYITAAIGLLILALAAYGLISLLSKVFS